MKELADLTAPAAITRKRLEHDVQEDCVKWARARGYWARKFSSISQRSVPDYLFGRQTSDGYVPHEYGMRYAQGTKIKFATEFKREGAKRDKLTGLMSTEAQIEEQDEMRQAGWYVFECDDFEVFKRAVIAYEQEVAR